MSVINQMLHDLENRRSQVTANNNFSYSNLSFIPKLSNTHKFETIIYILLVGVILTTVSILSLKAINAEKNTTFLTKASTSHDITLNSKTDSQLAVPVKNIQVTNKVDGSEQEPVEYEVATSVIHLHDKVVIKKIPAKKHVQTQQIKSTLAPVKSSASNEGIVHKHRRELPLSQRAENRYQSGYEYLLAKNNERAQEELRNALMLMPRHNKSRELLAGIYIKNGRLVEARTLLQYGMRISPTHSIFAKLYARILMDQNDNITAISVLLRNPPAQVVDSDYYALLAALYQKNKQHHKAATLYGQLLKIRKNYGVWWLGMAISLEALGNSSQAKLAYEKAKNSGNLSKGLYQYTNQKVTALSEIAFP